MSDTRLAADDALVIVDVQNDFLPGGNLAVESGDEVVGVLNAYIERFRDAHLPVYATRDWHPDTHCSFRDFGGIWPPHCIAGSTGAMFPSSLALPSDATIVSKAVSREKDAYSGFEGTGLAEQLRARRIKRLFVGGLATDYCILNTVLDALGEGFDVALLRDAVRAVNLQPGDGEAAVERMQRQGARTLTLDELH